MSAKTSHYLVFGDLHGRIVPAFRLAMAWSREHSIALDGILQVGDLGYFPDPTRLDRATKKHADKDPLELGAQWIVEPSKEAKAVFQAENAPPPMWFIAGNHEDYEALEERRREGESGACAFAVDYFQRVWCIRDGQVAPLPGGLRVGGLWGVDNESRRARQNVPSRGYIRPRSAAELSASVMDVLLTHDSPSDAVIDGAGSERITEILILAEPRFAFFGHYHGDGHAIDAGFKHTEIYHMAGFELRGDGDCADSGSVGHLSWSSEGSRFEYLDDAWLRTFSRHNWRHR